MYCITSSSWGGAQLHVLELCRDQVRRGNDVCFVVGNEGPLLDKIKEIKKIRIFLLPSLKRKVSPFSDFKSVFALRRLIKKEKPDILHLHSSKAGTIGRLAAVALREKTKVIFTVHGWAFTDGVPSKSKRCVYRFVEKLVSPLTTLFICVSNYDKKIGIRDKVLTKQSKVVVVHNGSPEPPKKYVNFSVHNPVRLVMIARFSSQKNQRMLINAMSNLNKELWNLTFVGDGETLNQCKELVKKLNLNSNINFVGFKDDISQYLIENDVYILTSFYEGLPISIIEAMSYGLPVVASNVGGNSELVKSEVNGYLINSQNELENVISRFIASPKKIREMGEKSLERFKSALTLDGNLEKINTIYKKICDK